MKAISQSASYSVSKVILGNLNDYLYNKKVHLSDHTETYGVILHTEWLQKDQVT